MEQYKKEFIEFMMGADVLRFGDFVTKSGRNTPYFVNTGNYKTGAQLSRLGSYYAQLVKDTVGDDFEAMFGPAYKGIPLVTAAAGAQRVFDLMDQTPEKDEGYVELVNAREDAEGRLYESAERTNVWAWKHPHRAEGTVTRAATV